MKRLKIVLLAGLLTLSAAFAGKAQVLMSGDVDFQVYGSRIRIFVEDITNLGDETTDRLRFRVWGTKDRDDHFSEGRIFAVGLIPRIFPHRDLDDVRRTLHLFRPSTGWYYVTLTLEERTFDEEGQVHWEVRDVVEFDGLHYFSRSRDYFPFPF
jgi:hypothetical protein